MARNINRQNLLCVELLKLRRHFMTCRKCRAAMKVRDFGALCDSTKTSLVEVAVKWDRNIAGRLAARNSREPHMFPCPDPNAHGPAYAITAEALIVTAHQDGLF